MRVLGEGADKALTLVKSGSCPCTIPVDCICVSKGLCFRSTGDKRGVSTVVGRRGTSFYMVSRSRVIPRGCAACFEDIVTFNGMRLMRSVGRVHHVTALLFVGCSTSCGSKVPGRVSSSVEGVTVVRVAVRRLANGRTVSLIGVGGISGRWTLPPNDEYMGRSAMRH